MVTEHAIEFIDLGAQRARIGARVDAAIARVLEHGRFILGPEVAECERRLAEFCGARHAIGCANGTDALVLACRALELRPGDAVVVPSYTFCATAEAVALLGGVPVFAEVDAATFNLAPASIDDACAAAARRGLEVRGVIAVDLFGQLADYAAIGKVARQRGIWVIADAAQSFGARSAAGVAGTLGTIATTSFFPAKPLGCYGDGGAVFTADDGLARTIESLRVHGKGSDKYDNVRIGYNSRLDTLQAAVLIEKLAVFAEELQARQRIADRYAAGLGDIVTVPQLAPDNTSTWAQYTLLLPPGARDAVATALKAGGIPTAIYYPTPLHRQTAYRHFPAVDDLSVSDDLAARALSLPMHAYLDEATQDRIVAAVREALAAA